MQSQSVLTRILAVVGTALVWIPLLAPALFAAVFLAHSGMFRFDYLMPAELFPLALAGGCALLWAALRAHSRRVLIGASLGGAVALLFGSQAIAVATGLASGRTEPTGWQWALVLMMLALYALALAVMGVGGALLARDLFRK
jgi:peptidoglycan/LPS O-acetylase OafA/YrhL